MKRKICVVITARPSYSRVKTVLLAIKKHPKLELQLVVTSSALLARYGSVIHFMEQDGFRITARIETVIEGENPTTAAKTTGLGMIELATVFSNIKPDVVVTIADRSETLATAACAAIMHIPLAHIQGGELTGNIDDKIRHAVTKLADIHFVTTTDAQIRIIGLGEQEDSIHLTGCPSIDIAAQVRNSPDLDFNPCKKYGGVGNDLPATGPYLVVMQHPVTNEYHLAKKQISIIQKAVRQMNMPAFWFWPNADAGSGELAKGIRHFREEHENTPIRYFRNMDSIDFLKLLKNAACLIGNSSVGIRECSFLGIPVVNIGNRQAGRQRGNNVIDAGCNQNAIMAAVRLQLHHGHYAENPIYGDGHAGEKIADILSKTSLKCTKKMTY